MTTIEFSGREPAERVSPSKGLLTAAPEIIDFKKRCFGRPTLKNPKNIANGFLCEKIMVEMFSIGGKSQEDGFYPSGNRYLRNPSVKDFVGKDKKVFEEFTKSGPYNVSQRWASHVSKGLKATSVLKKIVMISPRALSFSK